MRPEPAAHEPLPSAVLPVLVENHRRFLGFLKSKVGDEATAEEILQAAFVKGIEGVGALQSEESVLAWFYRVLRNAVIDHYRHQGAENRVLMQFAREMPEQISEARVELTGPVCHCIVALLDTLRAEDGDLIRRVDLNDSAVVDVAAENGISAGNARVRLHRARQALRKRVEETCGTCAVHGCMNCSCAARGSVCGV